ncbi:unnamed protein product, partial [Choristocarpus tenellus]
RKKDDLRVLWHRSNSVCGSRHRLRSRQVQRMLQTSGCVRNTVYDISECSRLFYQLRL